MAEPWFDELAEFLRIPSISADAAHKADVVVAAQWVRDFIRQGMEGLLARDETELTRHLSRLALDTPFREYVRHRNTMIAPQYDWSDVRALHLAMYAHAAKQG